MLTNISESDIEKAFQLIQTSTNIAIIPHRSPDGDAIGAALAVKFALRQIGKRPKTICIDPPPQNTKFLPETDQFLNELDLPQYELLIFVDCGAHYMSKFHEIHPNLFAETRNTINIDHHGSNDMFAKVNLVEPHAASTTQILYTLFQKWGIKIDPNIATCLLTGIYFDTGSFKHNNTTPAVLKTASKLTSLGADFQSISKHLFKQTNVNKLKLWGKTLSNAKRNQRKIVSSAVKKNDYKESKTSSKDLEGVIDYLNAVPESKFCILLSEDQKGGVKASLRTQSEDTDLSKIAEVFGGGGHKMASGFRIPGKIKEEKHWTIE